MGRSGRIGAGFAVVVMASAAWLGATSARGAADPLDLLPDLKQEAPRDVSLTRIRGRDLLGFRSAVQNVGVGPLTIVGARPSLGVRDMRAVQVVTRRDGAERSRPDAGFLRYVSSPDHSHWHFFPFQRYELRRIGARQVVVRDAKSGFCLGDRYRVEPRPDQSAPAAVYTTNCGLRSPRRLTIREGISVGWADDYAAYLDGQHIDVTGVPPGRYLLVHRVNASGRLEEANPDNNVATVRIELSRGVSGRLRVRVLPPA